MMARNYFVVIVAHSNITTNPCLVADANGHFRDGMSHFRDVKTVHRLRITSSRVFSFWMAQTFNPMRYFTRLQRRDQTPMILHILLQEKDRKTFLIK